MKQTDLSNFSINSFSLKSKNFIFLMVLLLLLSNFSVLGLYRNITNSNLPTRRIVRNVALYALIIFSPIIFGIFVKWLRALRFLPIVSVKILSKIGFLISIFPSIEFRGKWYIESEINPVSINSFSEMLKFIYTRIKDFVIIPLGIIAILFQSLDLLDIIRFDERVIEGRLTNPLTLLGLVLVNILVLLYYHVVWIWKDSGLYIFRSSKSKKGEVEEVTKLYSAGESLRNFTAFVTGISTFSWLLAQKLTSVGLPDWSIVQLLLNLLILILSFCGSFVVMGVLYYRSSLHVESVNKFREYFSKSDNLKFIPKGSCKSCEGTGTVNWGDRDQVAIMTTQINNYQAYT